jgi:hypothetical protein
METTNNRKRANRIAAGVIAVLLISVAFIITFPSIFIGTILVIGAAFGLYFLFKTVRNLTEESLDEQDRLNKWKQEKNIR